MKSYTAGFCVVRLVHSRLVYVYQHRIRTYCLHLQVRSNFYINTRVGTLIVATIYLQLIQNIYMFQSFTVLQCSHQHCVQPVVSDVEVVGYL